MPKSAGFALMLSVATLWGCSSTVVVPVPPRMDLKSYGTLGIVEFAANADPAIGARATREFQAHLHAAQPGTGILELGTRDALLASVGSRQLDAEALRRTAKSMALTRSLWATSSIPNRRPTSASRTSPSSRAACAPRSGATSPADWWKPATGASVWSSSAWARRQVGRLNVSAERGVSGAMRSSDPREEMVPALMYRLTEDFRPSAVRQKK